MLISLCFYTFPPFPHTSIYLYLPIVRWTYSWKSEIVDLLKIPYLFEIISYIELPTFEMATDKTILCRVNSRLDNWLVEPSGKSVKR
jgi:hypothetical protein